MSANASIAVAYGDPLGRVAICAMLAEIGSFRVMETAYFEGLLQLLASDSSVQIVILDLDLPGMGADVGLKYLRTTNGGIKIAVFASDDAQAPIDRLIGIGIEALVSKHQARPRLVAELARFLSEPSRDRQPLESDPPTIERARQQDFFGHALTVRQRDVLRAMISGKTNRQISELLNISEGTVKVHLNAAFNILGVHNRVGAAAAFMKLGQGEDHADHPPLL